MQKLKIAKTLRPPSQWIFQISLTLVHNILVKTGLANSLLTLWQKRLLALSFQKLFQKDTLVILEHFRHLHFLLKLFLRTFLSTGIPEPPDLGTNRSEFGWDMEKILVLVRSENIFYSGSGPVRRFKFFAGPRPVWNQPILVRGSLTINFFIK